VKNYLDFLEEAYLIFSLPKYDYSLKKQIINDRKIYSIDLGLAREVSFSFSENRGRFLENLVFLELKRHGQEIYYYKDKLECDFLIRRGRRIASAIQVSQQLDSQNREREISGLLAALKEYKLRQGLVLTYDQSEEIIRDKFKIILKPVWQWLLAG
jgi:predicted AAA+ superfamily ATPase